MCSYTTTNAKKRIDYFKPESKHSFFALKYLEWEQKKNLSLFKMNENSRLKPFS